MLRLPWEIDELGQEQFGLVSHPQLRTVCSASRIARLRAAALIFGTLDPGVHRLAGAKVSFRQRARGLTLCRPHLVISHLAAARLYQAASVAPPPLYATALRGRGPVNRSDVTTYRRSLTSADVTTKWGIPVTTPARTVLDLSSTEPATLVLAVYDDLARDRHLGPTDLERRLDAGDLPTIRRPVLDDLLGRRRGLGPGASPQEDWMLDAILDAQLPAPVRNHRVWLTGGVREVDLAWIDARVALDYDSWQYHRDRSGFHRDRDKAAAFLDAGWELFQVTSEWTAEVLVERVSRALYRRGGMRLAR